MTTSYVGLFLVAVGLAAFIVDQDPLHLWPKKSVPVVETESVVEPKVEDKRLDDILAALKEIAYESSTSRNLNQRLVDDVKTKTEIIEKKFDYYDQALKNQKPPVIHMPEQKAPVIHFPETVKIELVQPVEIKGSLDLQTPEGQRLRVLHQPGKSRPPGLKAVGVGNAPATFESVKKQIEGLSR